MSKSALRPLQVAVYGELSGDAPLAAMVTGIFDAVPDQQPYPYSVIGDATAVPFRTFGRDGAEVTITVHTWSQFAGFSEAQAIDGRIQEVLDDAELEVEGFGVVMFNYEETTTIRDPDGITRHLASRYRVIVQEAQ